MGSEKLTPAMAFWLREIAEPSADTEPFPPQNTVNALLRRGFIEEHRDMDDIMCRAFGVVQLRATDAGRAALSTKDTPHE